MMLASAGAFTWWSMATGQAFTHPKGNDVVVYAAWTACIVTCVLAIVVGISVRRSADPALGAERFGLRAIFELITEFLGGLAHNVVGHDGHKLLWLLVPMFVYILVSNLLGLVPGFLPPSDNINNNLAMGLVIFLGYQLYGFKSSGLGYLWHFWAPKQLMKGGLLPIGMVVGVLLCLIELFSHAFRPLTLSIRLYGNMQGDHTVFGTFLGMVPLGVPVILALFGLLVSFVQAFVFTLLSMVYMGLASSHDH